MPDDHPALSRRGLLAATSAALLGTGETPNRRAGGPRTAGVQTRDGVVADPGDVQGTIDRVANAEGFARGSYTRVALRTGTTYTPDRTWKVKRGVVLDFGGAKLVPTGDRDVLHLHPEAHLVRPFVDVRDRSYSGTAIVFDTRYGKYGGPNRSTVDGAHLLSKPGDGTGIALHDRNGEGIWDVQVSGMVQGFDTGVLLRASDRGGGFVNSNHFDLTANAYGTAVAHRGAPGAAVNGNYFDLVAQPAEISRHLWDLGGEAAFNTMEADVWDKRLYRDQSRIVRFDGGGDNTLIDRFGYTSDAHAKGPGRVTSPQRTGLDSRNGNGSVDEAGTGSGASDQPDGGERTLVVEGTGSYTVVVDGSVRVASDVEQGKLFGGDAVAPEGPQAGRMSIEGEVIGGTDRYAVTGRVVRQRVRGEVTITVEEPSV